MRIICTTNYKLASITAKLPESEIGYKRDYAGLVVNVENAAGTDRIGVDPDGHEWRSHMKYDYGFIYHLTGEDGEGIDVYLGPDQESEHVYVVHQVNPETGDYDEDKVMLGFDDPDVAKEAYLEHYDSPDFFGAMDEITMTEFKKAVDENDPSIVEWNKKNKRSKK